MRITKRDQSQASDSNGRLKLGHKGNHCSEKQQQQQGEVKVKSRSQQQQQIATTIVRVIGNNNNSSRSKRMATITLTKGTFAMDLDLVDGSSTGLPLAKQMQLHHQGNRTSNNFRLVGNNLHALVKKRIEKPMNYHWAKQQFVLSLVAILVLTTSLPKNYQFHAETEAKIHHSKRQAPNNNNIAGQQQSNFNGAGSSSSSSSSSPGLTGRESTNWWNVWWQQYINEAVQPTVRPIVAVSFNGQTINLSEQQQGSNNNNNVDLASPSNNIATQFINQADMNMAGDVDANLVFNNQNGATNGDIERSSERLINQPANELPETNNNNIMDKQTLLAHKKTMQHQMHWQSVKPTIIQPTAGSMGTRDLRTNRQVNDDEELIQNLPISMDRSSSGNMGIQMRASMNTRRQQQAVNGKPNTSKPQQLDRPRFLSSPAQNLIHQQQIQQEQMNLDDMLGNSRFEQQQHQMVDYSEETEPDMDEANKTDDDNNRSRTSTDSSSSSIMQEDRPAQPGMRKSTMDTNGIRQQPANQGPRMLVMGMMGPQSATTTSGEQQSVQSTSRRPQPPPMTTTTTIVGNNEMVDNLNRVEPTGDSGITQQTSTSRSSTPTSSQASFSTTNSTPAPTTTTTTTTTTAIKSTPQETPVTKGPSTMTTSGGGGGRVQLENGRPATGTRQQQGTTNAVRPPTITTQFRSMMPEVSTTPSSKTSLSQTTTIAPTTSTSNMPTTTTTMTTTSQSQGVTSTTSGSSGSSSGSTGDGASIANQSPTTTTSTITGNSRSQFETTTMKSSSGVSSTTSNEQETTTLRPVTTTSAAASGNDTSTESGNDESDGEEEDEDGDQVNTNNGNSTNLMNSSDGSEDEDEEEETSTGQDQLTTTTTAATPNQTGVMGTTATLATTTTTTTASGQPQQVSTSRQQQTSLPTTTQQPTSMTTIDIERLPKGSSAMMNNMRGISPVQSTTPANMLSSTTTSGGDIARIQMDVGSGGSMDSNSDNSANVIMIPIGGGNRRPTTAEEEMAITMPMDALMKMMNQVVQDNREREQIGGTSPGMSMIQITNETPLTTTTLPATTSQPPTTPVNQDGQEFKTDGPNGSSMLPATTTKSSQFMPIAEGGRSTPGDNSQDQTFTSTSATPRRKLPQPPPPTPRAGIRQQQQQPMQMQTNFVENPPINPNQMPTSSMTGDSQQPNDKMMNNMMLSLENEREVSQIGDDAMMSGGREPKIELINLDLMPIQRIMGGNRSSLMDQTAANRNFERERLTQQMQQQQQQQMQQGPMFSNDNTTRIISSSQPNQPMEQVVIAEVEPGMRLRPPTGGSSFVMGNQQQQQQQSSRANSPIIMSDMMNNKNQANTVYMIMMNSPQTTSTTTTGGGVDQTSGGPMTKTSGLNDVTGSQLPMTTMMMRKDQSRTTNQPTTTKTTATNMLDRTFMSPSGSQTTSKQQQMMMRTTQAAFMPSSSPTTSGGSSFMPSTKNAPTTTSTAKQQQQQQQQKQMMMIQMSRQTTLPISTTTTTTTPATITTTTVSSTSIAPISDVDSENRRQTGKPTGDIDGSVMKTKQQQHSSKTFSPTGTTATATSDMDQKQSTTTAAAATASTSQSDQLAQTTTRASTARDDSVTMTPTTTITTTTTAANVKQSSIGPEENDRAKLQRLQVQPMTNNNGDRRQQQVTKTSGKTGKSSNMTQSSFIPTKLRNNFSKPTVPDQNLNGKLTQQMDQTTQSTLTGAAIRQFGGANRMSVLGNQPVPFGRPAAMTMQPASSRQGGPNSRVLELPTFEYGPSIAVRRPDEPLANGQIPNCTLTGKNFCVLTKDYPMNEVRQAVERSFRSVRIMYEELQTVSDQELHKDDFNATNNQAASGKFACQTQVEMMRPGWAKDEITKEWMLVVNTDVFPQRVRTESCAQPNTPCEFIAPFYDSTCQQRYSLHRMIAIDPHDPSRSPQVAVFKFPAGCVCRVHPIRKTTIASMTSVTTPIPTTVVTSSTNRSVSRRRR